jgi:hypothetical protein
MKENKTFYNEDFRKNPFYYSRGHYAVRNRMVAERLKPFKLGYVLEIAGAEGHLAKCILQTCNVESYDFTDYSDVGLERAIMNRRQRKQDRKAPERERRLRIAGKKTAPKKTQAKAK